MALENKTEIKNYGKVDKAILDVNLSICKNIALCKSERRGFVSQNILGQIRTFVEYVIIKVCSPFSVPDPYNQEDNKSSLKKLKEGKGPLFLKKFHDLLQESVSHYAFDEDISERLMLKYYEYLLEIKEYLKHNYGMEVLDNIEEFPLNTDNNSSEYYKKIAEKIDNPLANAKSYNFNTRLYIHLVKPFFINKHVYYEISFNLANSNVSKFNRVIAFSKVKIPDNYAVKMDFHTEYIKLYGLDIPVQIVDKYKISIRPCELSNFSKIFGKNIEIKAQSKEYDNLMTYLTISSCSLNDLLSMDESYYFQNKKQMLIGVKEPQIFPILDRCRVLIKNGARGSNVLRYLLFRMSNRVIKDQLSNFPSAELSNLYLTKACLPFEEKPFCTSLKNHNPKFYDIIQIFSEENREDEVIDRVIANNTEKNNRLFSPISKFEKFKGLDTLIEKFNGSLYPTQKSTRSIQKFRDYLYISGYEMECGGIIRRLIELAKEGIPHYSASVKSWMEDSAYKIDDDTKIKIMASMFSDSKVSLIYGSAGTGKSTLINHIAHFWSKQKKLFLAQTNPAIDNLQSKVQASNCDFYTIFSFLSSSHGQPYDILFIDECSTVSNRDMLKLLQRVSFKLLVLVGDIHQIESIAFGNWFSLAPYFVPNKSIHVLEDTYRTQNKDLKLIWKRVREKDDGILEVMSKTGCFSNLNETIFQKNQDDEILLCLNYNGLYGINNINRLLQSQNPHQEYLWGINSYKIGDPILFNESNRFSPLIHNNSKGRIVDIKLEKDHITFSVELDKAINALDSFDYDFKLAGISQAGHSIIEFDVFEPGNSDLDEEIQKRNSKVPFQVAYAISFHKAQGLEFDSVKIVVTDEIEDQISSNIFYTAITRAKSKLKIYWSPETQNNVLKKIIAKNENKDPFLFSQLEHIPINKRIQKV